MLVQGVCLAKQAGRTCIASSELDSGSEAYPNKCGQMSIAKQIT